MSKTHGRMTFRPTTPEEKTMWAEYREETKAGATSDALHAWASKHHVQVTSENTLGLKSSTVVGGDQ